MPYFPPLNFGTVEDGLYRSAVPTEINFQFLQTLSLNTVIILSPDAVDEPFLSFLEDFSINSVYIENKNAHIAKWSPIAEETVIDTLKLLLDRSNYPILITCKLGKSLTGAVIGCFRKLQRWSMVSIFEEYRRYAIGAGSSGAGSKVQQLHEQFIELFDTDLVTVTDRAPSFLQFNDISIPVNSPSFQITSATNSGNNESRTSTPSKSFRPISVPPLFVPPPPPPPLAIAASQSSSQLRSATPITLATSPFSQIVIENDGAGITESLDRVIAGGETD